MQIEKMGMTKYRLYVIAAICLLILWFTLLYTSNYYYSSTYKVVKEWQYHSPKFTLTHNSYNDTLVNLENFKFVMNNATLCMQSTSESSIAIMVHTARSNFDQRYAIRNTWGSIKVFKERRLHLIFLLGIDQTMDRESYSESETRLLQESEQHGDIIMGNFVDSYKNLSYKHIMGYKWVSTFCPTAEFILKTDDDIYADIFQIIEVLLVELINSKKTYVCENMGGNKPIRESNSKWYVPEELFAEEFYPDFCSGSAYLVKAVDAAKIYSVSNKTNFFWMDDVFVTGILHEKDVSNRYKTRLQIQAQKIDQQFSKLKYRGMVDAFIQISQQEGVRALYSGISPAVLRQATYGTIKFGTYYTLKSIVTERGLLLDKNGDERVFGNILCAVAAGAISSAIANPTDVLKVRMQVHGRGTEELGLFGCFKQIYRSEGVTGLWRGVGPTAQRAAVIAAVEVPVYDFCKFHLMEVFGDQVSNHFISSFVASLGSAIASTPIDVIRTRLMNQRIVSSTCNQLTATSHTIYSGSIDCAVQTVRNEGFAALYKGFIPTWVRMGPWNIIFFITYEQLKQFY